MFNKDKKPTSMNLWATVDVDKVKKRINRVAVQIEKVLLKYELPEEIKNSLVQSRFRGK